MYDNNNNLIEDSNQPNRIKYNVCGSARRMLQAGVSRQAFFAGHVFLYSLECILKIYMIYIRDICHLLLNTGSYGITEVNINGEGGGLIDTLH